MRNLREGINRKFSFLFPDGNLEVISGKQEGETEREKERERERESSLLF